MHQFQGNWFKLLFPPIEGGVTATVRLVSGLTGCSFTQFGFATGANDVANAFATSVRGCRGLWREGRTKDTVPGPGGGGGQGDFRGRRANSEGQRSPARKGGSEEHSQKIADKGGMSEGRLMHIPVCDVPREQGATGGGGGLSR